MARFDSAGQAESLLARFMQGGPQFDLAGLEQLLTQRSQQGFRRSVAGDLSGLQRAGMGRSVAGAFSAGSRGQQSTSGLLDALTGARGQAAQFGLQKQQSIMPLLSQILSQRFQQSQQPSFLSSLLGGGLGLGAQLFGPGLASKAFGNPQLDMIQRLFGGGGGGQQQSRFRPQQPAFPEFNLPTGTF